MCPVGKFQNWFYIHYVYGRYYSRMYRYTYIVLLLLLLLLRVG